MIGGATVALDYVRRSLLAGKHVVTANKELVATHGHELLMLAKERNSTSSLRPVWVAASRSCGL